MITLLCTVSLAGCGGFAERIAVSLFYQKAVLPQDQVHKDLSYWAGPGADPRKHRLDLYVSDDSGWPVLIFVHGGNWKSGDKGLQFGDVDPYGNIGRFYAGRGIGVAIVNYRLQPAVTWYEQVKDIARALAWVYRHAADYGGNPRAIFISGHSSGAQLAVRTILDQELLQELGLSSRSVCGVIPVSGAPFDLADEKTDSSRFEKHLRAGHAGERWKHEASSVSLVTRSTPPFLLLHGRWEPKGVKRQNQLMHQALTAAGVQSRLVVTPWEGHSLMVAALSRPKKMASTAILDFIRGTRCP
jgi:acetyl esterase/lipase